MASRLGRQAFSRAARATRTVPCNACAPRIGRRLMSADASRQFKAPSDMPWIIGAVVVAGPALAYLLKDTVAIKKKIAAGHHGHDPHDAHADKHFSSEDHASPAVMKDDEGTEADVSSALSNATATDAPKAADAAPAESSSDAAEPPKDEKEPEGTESK